MGIEHFVVLTGSLRTGTSWRKRALNQSPNISLLHESNIFGRSPHGVRTNRDSYLDTVAYKMSLFPLSEYQKQAFGESDPPEQLVRDVLGEKMPEGPVTSDSVRTLLDRITPKVPMAGDKFPAYTINLPEIYDHYDDMKVLLSMRDPWDVAMSILTHEDRSGWWVQSNANDAVELACERFGQVHDFVTNHDTEDYYIWSYEELAENPETSWSKVSAFLDVKLGGCMEFHNRTFRYNTYDSYRKLDTGLLESNKKYLNEMATFFGYESKLW